MESSRHSQQIVDIQHNKYANMKSTFKFVFLHSMINTDFKVEHRGEDVRFTEEAWTVYDGNMSIKSFLSRTLYSKQV